MTVPLSFWYFWLEMLAQEVPTCSWGSISNFFLYQESKCLLIEENGGQSGVTAERPGSRWLRGDGLYRGEIINLLVNLDMLVSSLPYLHPFHLGQSF